ncbi:MAG: pseudouridine synthase [Gammaproteobacteria bacterium]
MLILFNKPWGVLSQFRDPEGRPTLADFVDVPDVYPAGRLDRDSEGLMLLTDDGRLQAALTQPRRGVWKRYWVHVEGEPGAEALDALARGVDIRGGRTRPARARWLSSPPALWPREPPVRYRKRVPDAWLELEIAEGRNRQVRRMTAAVGLPTLRLVRVAVGPWSIDDLGPGEWREARIPGDFLSGSGPRRSAGQAPGPARSSAADRPGKDRRGRGHSR